MEWLTVSQVEKETGINQVTIRRYINKHSLHLNVKKNHKSYFIDRNSVPTIKKIRELYANNMTAEQVDEALANMSIPATFEIKENDGVVSIDAVKTLLELKRDNEQLKENQRIMIEKLEEQQRYIEKSLNERDKLLMERLRIALEVREESKKVKKKRRWLPF